MPPIKARDDVLKVRLENYGRYMDVTEVLDELRADATGCELAAYADLSAGTVLCTSSGAHHAQEELDALSATAGLVLQGGVAASAQGLLADSSPEMAITTTSVDARVFLKSPADPHEALICICAPGADLSKIVSCGRSALDRIVQQN